MDTKALRVALAAAASAITGLNTHAYMEAFTEPAFLIEGYTVDYDEAMARGLDVLDFVGALYVSGSDPQAQGALDDYLAGSGATSVRAALEVDATLGGECAFVEVRGWRDYAPYKIGEAEFYGAKVDIHIEGPGS